MRELKIGTCVSRCGGVAHPAKESLGEVRSCHSPPRVSLICRIAHSLDSLHSRYDSLLFSLLFPFPLFLFPFFSIVVSSPLARHTGLFCTTALYRSQACARALAHGENRIRGPRRGMRLVTESVRSKSLHFIEHVRCRSVAG